MATSVLPVKGMTCQHCARHVREELERVPGVASARVDLAHNQATVEHKNVDLDALNAAIVEAGYKPE